MFTLPLAVLLLPTPRNAAFYFPSASLPSPPPPSLAPVFTPPPLFPHLTGADRAAVAVQHPDLPAVLDLAVVDAVAGAVVSVGTAAVVASVQVEADGVVGAGVHPRLAFVNI